MRLLDTTETTYRFEGGVTLPRVTSILSLVHRFDGIPADVLQHASERGKAVHRAVWILAGGAGGRLDWSTVHPEVLPYVRAYEAAQKALGFDVVDKERLVISRRFGFAGRMDLLVWWQGKTGILDLKAAEEHWSHRYQISAYVAGYQDGFERYPPRLRRWVLYLKPAGIYRLVDLDEDGEQAEDFRKFCAIRDTYALIQAHGGSNGH